MALYFGNGGAARQVSALYAGANGVNVQLSHLYTANGGAARQVYAAGKLLSSLALGSAVTLPEGSGTAQYRVWDTDYRGSGYICLMREGVLSQQRIYSSSSGTVEYAGSELDAYLTGTFFASFPEEVRTSARSVDISPDYDIANGVNRGTPVLRKVLIPSLRELGNATGPDAPLAWWTASVGGGADAASLRTARNAYGNGAAYWLRTWRRYDSANRIVSTGGYFDYRNANAYSVGVRPVLVLDGNYVVPAV